MGSLTSRVVTRLASLPSTAASYVVTGTNYDYAIGGLPWLSGASTQRPIVRKTAEYKKQQVDQMPDPGEQSLQFWWLRSQLSFHGGAGLVYQEPDLRLPYDPYAYQIQFRYQDSLGVDPFGTVGKATLLPATYKNVAASGAVMVHGCVDSAGPTDIYLQAEGATLKRCTDGASTSITWGGAGTILSIADDGTNYYVADSVGIWKGTLAGGAGAKIWNTGSATVALGWVKQRLMAGIGPSLYDLSPAGSGGPALPAANYTHSNANWQWTAISETPDSIIAAGYAGSSSSVYRLALNTSGVVPTLTAAILAMQFPQGERVYSLLSYLGDYVAVGTDRGVRIASMDTTSGSLQYGPLCVVSSQPVYDLAGRDRFVYASATNQLSGKSGIWAIDLATQTAFRKFAFATHLQTHVTGACRSVELFGSSNRLVLAVDANGSYLEDLTNLEPSGWLLTGNIRFHTLEPKLYKYARARTTALQGSLAIAVVDPTGGETTLAAYGAAGSTVLDETAFGTNLGPQEYVALRFTLTRDGSLTNTGPTFTGFQVKALPAAKRQRMFVLPLLCFDVEKDKYGNNSGGEGTAITRLQALEALEEAGDAIQLQDFSRHPMSTHLVVIEDIEFRQDTPPKDTSGWGGYVMLTVRTVT